MKLPWCLYRTRTNQRQQYSEMPRRHRSVFVPQHSFRTCLWGSVTPLHVCTRSARMYPWREYICRWHVHAEREELLGHDCRNHHNCWWAIMLSWRYRDETLDHLRYSRFPRKVSTDKTAVMASSLLPTRSCLLVDTCRWFPGWVPRWPWVAASI